MLHYEVLDVFTDVPFAGNPLAVVLDADELATGQLQALATEFNLSETAFPLTPSADERAAGADYRLRIFTPHTELPFAGHPSVGAAWLLARLGRVQPGPVRQACGAGILPLEIAPGPGQVELAGVVPSVGDPLDPRPVLASVGLDPTDLAGPEPRVASAGLAFCYLVVRAGAVARSSRRPDRGFPTVEGSVARPLGRPPDHERQRAPRRRPGRPWRRGAGRSGHRTGAFPHLTGRLEPGDP